MEFVGFCYSNFFDTFISSRYALQHEQTKEAISPKIKRNVFLHFVCKDVILVFRCSYGGLCHDWFLVPFFYQMLFANRFRFGWLNTK